MANGINVIETMDKEAEVTLWQCDYQCDAINKENGMARNLQGIRLVCVCQPTRCTQIGRQDQNAIFMRNSLSAILLVVIFYLEF